MEQIAFLVIIVLGFLIYILGYLALYVGALILVVLVLTYIIDITNTQFTLRHSLYYIIGIIGACVVHLCAYLATVTSSHENIGFFYSTQYSEYGQDFSTFYFFVTITILISVAGFHALLRIFNRVKPITSFIHIIFSFQLSFIFLFIVPAVVISNLFDNPRLLNYIFDTFITLENIEKLENINKVYFLKDSIMDPQLATSSYNRFCVMIYCSSILFFFCEYIPTCTDYIRQKIQK